MEQVDFSSREAVVRLLGSSGEEREALFRQAAAVKSEVVGNKVYFRGLIEFSNRCRKNCLYCGIRSGNNNVERYSLSDEEVVQAARFALDNRYGSIVLQSGELESKAFTQRIDRLLRKIHMATGGKLRITLSCGEQEPDVYRRWFESGGQRYLLRIEASNPELYAKLHPLDGKHRFLRRMECLESIRNTGYQTGTGVMIGLPFQTLDDLAGDLLFIRDFAADMVGMGPYLEHADTPLYTFRDQLLPKQERFDLTLKMIALLRLMMPGINMAATTAMQAIDPAGREKAILVGANVIMPNITPGSYRDNYLLYEGKPCTAENPDDCSNCLEARVAITGHQIAWEEWGDSALYTNRTGSNKKPGTA